ncbi:putative phospholipid hydroperoxide glutathione peroxidase, partial [Cooperia oncophora]
MDLLRTYGIPHQSMSFVAKIETSSLGMQFRFQKVSTFHALGKVLIVVNVASQCGLTNANYTQFKELLDKYKSQGLEVAAFPCNQFGGQEPACELDIKNFVASKFNFEPDLYAKVNVNGDNADPLFKFLKKEQVGGTMFDAIKWNFTKFLVDREGNIVK